MKIGDIVRGEAGYLDVALGIVVNVYTDILERQNVIVLWLDGLYEGKIETFTENEDLEVIA